MAYPTTLDTFVNRTNAPGLADTADTSYVIATGSLQGYGYYNDILATLTQLETKLGVDASAVATTIDYLLKNTASINPGHHHSNLYALNNSRIEIQTDNNGNGNVTINGTRFQGAQGAVVASANNLTLGNDGNAFQLSGVTTVNLIDTTSWQNGSEILLYSNSGLTFAHNQAPSGAFHALFLSGSANFVAAANARIKFTLMGGNWVETSRTSP